MATRHRPNTRARDADRGRTCEILDSALADGQLSMAEHQHRIAAATKATTLGELDRVTADLQSAETADIAAPRPPSAMFWGLIAALVVAVVALSVVLSIDSDTDAPASDTPSTAAAPTPEPLVPDTDATADGIEPSVLKPPRDLHTAEGMTGLLDQMRKRFGDTTGIELAITDNDAMLFRPDPTDERSKLLYRFDYGWGDPTRRPRDDDDESVDLGAFDMNAVAAALKDAPSTLGLAPGDVSEMVVDIDHIAEPGGPGGLELLVKVESNRGDGYIYLDSAGNTKRVEQPR